MPEAESGSARRPRARLDPELIRRTALDLLDEHGTAGFTMRALAARLGADPMAVYRHYRNKSELLAAILDTLLDELSALEPGGDWRGEIMRMAGHVHGRLREHPGLVGVLTSAPLTPASVAITTAAMDLLRDQGVPPPLAMAAVGALYSYLLGFAVLEHAGAHGETGAAGMTDPLAAIQGPENFEVGLALLLDGLQARLRR